MESRSTKIRKPENECNQTLLLNVENRECRKYFLEKKCNQAYPEEK